MRFGRPESSECAGPYKGVHPSPNECCASYPYGVSAMNQDQEHDYAYHQDKLLMLITRRARQQANSDQISKLDAEIAAIKDLLRSYRILKAME
jgi:hypothetical protein